MNMEEIRKNIDDIDDELCDLFKKRMDLALAMAEYKKEHGLAVLDQNREEQVLARISEKLGEPLDQYGRILFNTIFEVSKSYQNSRMQEPAGA